MFTASESSPEQHRCWAEIDLNQLRRNLSVYRSQLPAGAEIMAVAKDNAYGHGSRDGGTAL